MRIAMLTYSMKPRGGVVHAVEIAEGLQRRGHDVELVTLGRPGESLFRPTTVPVRTVRFTPPGDIDFDAKILAMLDAYADGLAPLLEAGAFDVVHAQDCLSANAALACRDAGIIDRVVRTVHHVDAFRSPSLIACQDRSILEPDHVVCVSEPWVARLRDEFGVTAGVVRNGVDRTRFRPAASLEDRQALRDALGLTGRHVVLTVGGIEPRKGSLTLLEAFALLRSRLPERDPLLLVAGGATLFDYRDELRRFDARVVELGLEDHVRLLGPQPDGAVARLMQAADVFAFPSVEEGFGLAALEALASELPVVASDLDVFRGFMGDAARLVRVGDATALGSAMAELARTPEPAMLLRVAGRRVAEGYTWDAAATAQELEYAAVTAPLAVAVGAGVPDERLAAAGGEAPGNALTVEAVWRGGYNATVYARGHEIVAGEPLEDGGDDAGPTPTELLGAALASCFSLAAHHAARKRGLELPDLRVRVDAFRAERGLRYSRMVVTASSSLPAKDLGPIVERAERYCWVSNTLASPPEIAYRHITEPAPKDST